MIGGPPFEYTEQDSASCIRSLPALPFRGMAGDMTITSFSNGILKFKFTGMCSNCPSAWITTEELVKNEILSNVPEVKDVQMEFAVSDELIDMAKKLLNHET